MYKKILSSLFIIFISQSILFSQDNCEGLSQDECNESSFCEWGILSTPNGVFELCVEINDGNDDDWDDNGDDDFNLCNDFDETICESFPLCNWTDEGCVMIDDFFAPQCSELSADECDDGLFCMINNDGECVDDWGNGDDSDGDDDWDDNGDDDFNLCNDFDETMCESFPLCNWTDESCIMIDDFFAPQCSELSVDECDEGLFCMISNDGECVDDWGNDDDGGGWDECRQFESQDECLEAGCEWNDEDGCYGNWDHDDDNHEDGPPECLMDCEGIENVDPEENPYESCDWIISNFGPNNFMNQCAEDCDNETMMEINEYMEVCFQCLADNNCEDIFDNDDDDWDDECRQFESQDECLEAGCEWNDEDGCYGNWDHDDDCNPDLMCAEVETCIDGLLYPTSCGPENCDEPIDECNEFGVLYGYVEYIWGDAIEMVANARIQVEHIYSDSVIFETYTNDYGAYEILIPHGWYIVTVSAYEYSQQSNVINIESNQEYELNFQLGEWAGGEQQAVLSLGDGNGTQEGFTVPLYLQTDTSVSGLQFAVLPQNTGGGFWFTPSALQSTNDCFSASFNDVYGQLWGIMFSLEGCVYEPGEHHVANLSFTTTTNSAIPPGTDIHLGFNYTLVSDPDANEIPSSGEGSMVTFGQFGDVDSDGAINVLDIVNMVNFALQIDEPTEYEFWAADLNQDGDINVLDVISVVNIILYEDDLQRSDSGDAEIYQNEKEIQIQGSDVAGFQIVFSENIDINQIQIPDGWISKSHNNSLIAYTIDGNLLNGRIIINFNQSIEIIELIVADANSEAIMTSINVLPNKISFKGNFPNPFNPETSIIYTLSKDTQVNLSIYNLSGQVVQTLVNEQQYAGEFLISWSAQNLPSGIYIAQLMVDGESFTQKMMLMK